MQSYLVNYRTKLRQLVRLSLQVWGVVFVLRIGYSGNIDQLCRSAPLLIDALLETKTNGLIELGSACYGFGERLEMRVSVVISSGHEDLVNEKLHPRNLLKSFCETEELYKLARRIPIVWTYYTMEGTFYSEFPLDMDMCKTSPDQK